MYVIPLVEMVGVKHEWPYVRNGAIPYKYQKIFINHQTKIVQPTYAIFPENQCSSAFSVILLGILP